MKSGCSTDREIRHSHVIVNRADKTNDDEMGVFGSLLGCDFTCMKWRTEVMSMD